MARLPDDMKETPSQTAGPYVHIGLVPRAAGFGIGTGFGRQAACSGVGNGNASSV